MEPVSQVRFEFTREDFVAFNLYHHDHSPATRYQKRRIILIFGALGVILPVIKLMHPEYHELLYIFGGTSLLVAVTFPLNFRRGLRRNLDRLLSEGKNKGLLGPREVGLSPAEVRSTGTMGINTTAWPAVEKIVKHEDRLYIYTSSLSAVVIPRRAFESDAAFASFEETARKYLAEAAGRAK